MNSIKNSMVKVRTRNEKAPSNVAYDRRRSRSVSFGGGARNAMEKSCAEEGEEGVTMIAGSKAFSVMRGRDKS